MNKIRIFEDIDQLNHSAARMFFEIAERSIASRGRFTVSLAGGSTPRELYKLISSEDYRERIDWTKVFFFFGDERFVPYDHAYSNYRMAKENLFDRIELPASNVFPWNTGAVNEAIAAAEYEATITRFFDTDLPSFDLILLGIGADGHTASLFPHTAALKETERITAANYVRKLETTRLTMTYPLINNARHIAFLIAGDEKAEAVRSIAEGSPDPDEFPARGVSPSNGKLIWFLDSASAQLLTNRY